MSSILLCVDPQRQLKNTFRFRDFFQINFVVGISWRKKTLIFLRFRRTINVKYLFHWLGPFSSASKLLWLFCIDLVVLKFSTEADIQRPN